MTTVTLTPVPKPPEPLVQITMTVMEARALFHIARYAPRFGHENDTALVVAGTMNGVLFQLESGLAKILQEIK